MPKNHIDITTLLMEMRNELEDHRRKNDEEMENLKQENSRLKRKLVERELNTVATGVTTIKRNRSHFFFKKKETNKGITAIVYYGKLQKNQR